MQSESFLSLILSAGGLLGAFVGFPVWLDVARRTGYSRALGGALVAIGSCVSAWTIAALPVNAQQAPVSDSGPEFAAPADSSSSAQSTDSLTQGSLSTPELPEADEDLVQSTVARSQDRPEWVESSPVLKGETHRVAVYSEFQAREDDARRAGALPDPEPAGIPALESRGVADRDPVDGVSSEQTVSAVARAVAKRSSSTALARSPMAWTATASPAQRTGGWSRQKPMRTRAAAHRSQYVLMARSPASRLGNTRCSSIEPPARTAAPPRLEEGATRLKAGSSMASTAATTTEK